MFVQFQTNTLAEFLRILIIWTRKLKIESRKKYLFFWGVCGGRGVRVCVRTYFKLYFHLDGINESFSRFSIFCLEEKKKQNYTLFKFDKQKFSAAILLI